MIIHESKILAVCWRDVAWVSEVRFATAEQTVVSSGYNGWRTSVSPNGRFCFGAARANAPLHIQLRKATRFVKKFNSEQN